MNRPRGLRDPSRPDFLTQAFVDGIKKPGRYGDRRGGFGLSLLVKPDSIGRFSKSWAQRILWEGRPVSIGLGSAHHLSLKEARDRAARNYLDVKDGKDPRRNRSIVSPTFEQVTEQAITYLRSSWKAGSSTEPTMRMYMRNYAFPHIGRMPIDRITPRDVLAFLEPLALDKGQTAAKLKVFLSRVFKWAVMHNLCQDNPAGNNITLPKANEKHHEALPYTQVGASIRHIQASGKWDAPAVEFLILTAARSGEVREADWQEIDLDEATWTVPKTRMKASREHRVPLSGRALDILKAQRGRRGPVFPTKKGKFALAVHYRRLLADVRIRGTVHGFRSSFRDWCAENNVDRQLAEAALAHSVGDATEMSYFLSDLFALRRELMQRWADYLAGPALQKTGGEHV